jgi:preprotein translocase subunit Sec63
MKPTNKKEGNMWLIIFLVLGPFIYLIVSPIVDSISDKIKQKKYDKQKSSNGNSSSADLFSFYRNLLGLKLRFSQIELKNAYREAVGKYHPDRYGSSLPRDRENAEMLMKQVNEAYGKLKAVAE